MWQYLGLGALEIANERSREAREAADRWRLAREFEQGTRRPGVVARLLAAVLRGVSSASGVVSDAACTAATRLERRTA